MKENKVDYPVLIETVLFGDEKAKISQIVKLSHIFPEELAILERRFAESDPERRRIILQHMVDIVEDQDDYQYNFDPIFALCLTDSSAAVRLAAVHGLWETDNPRLFNQFFRMAQSDPEIDIRVRAIHIIGNYLTLAEWGEFPLSRTEPVVAQFFSWLEQGGLVDDIYFALIEVLPVTADERINQFLIRSYENGDEQHLLSAIIGMSNSCDPKWGDLLLDEIEHESERISLATIEGVGRMEFKQAIPALINASSTNNEEIRIAVVQALGKIGGDDARLALQTLLEEAEKDEDEALMEWIEDSLAELEMVEMVGLEFDLDDLDL